MVRPLRYFIQTNLLTSPFVPFVEKPENTNILNAAPRPAQRVPGAFTIVKATRRESLGIIKKREIFPRKKHGNQGSFHLKAHRENYQGANFSALAYNFHGHIR